MTKHPGRLLALGTLAGAASLALAAPPATSAGESPVPTPETDPRNPRGSFVRNLAGDFRYLVTFPARRTAEGTAKATAVLAGIAGLVLLDDEIRREVQERRRPALDRWERRIEPIGKVRHTSLGALAVYGIGQLARKPALAETGRALGEALLFTEVLDLAAKGAFGRKEPNPHTRAGQFFEGSSFFPSGHAARAFAFATVLAERHGRPAAATAYPIATLVGLSRIERDVHWASDVAAGALLGHFVSKAIVARRAERERTARPPDRPPRLRLVPGPGGIVLAISLDARRPQRAPAAADPRRSSLPRPSREP